MFRQAYDQKENERMSLETGYRETMPSLTQKQFAKDADLNELVKRFGVDKMPIPPAVMDPSYYGELPPDYNLATAMRTVREAQERFEALPAPLRERFANEPAQLWDFVNDSANADEAVALGLLVRPNANGGPQQPAGDLQTPVVVSPGQPSNIVVPSGS